MINPKKHSFIYNQQTGIYGLTVFDVTLDDTGTYTVDSGDEILARKTLFVYRKLLLLETLYSAVS